MWDGGDVGEGCVDVCVGIDEVFYGGGFGARRIGGGDEGVVDDVRGVWEVGRGVEGSVGEIFWWGVVGDGLIGWENIEWVGDGDDVRVIGVNRLVDDVTYEGVYVNWIYLWLCGGNLSVMDGDF